MMQVMEHHVLPSQHTLTPTSCESVRVHTHVCEHVCTYACTCVCIGVHVYTVLHVQSSKGQNCLLWKRLATIQMVMHSCNACSNNSDHQELKGRVY